MLTLIRGAGDLASGIALRLHRSGMQVVMTDLEKPLSIRRTVCFSEAIVHGETTVEDVIAQRAETARQAMEIVRANALRVYTAMGCRGLSRVDFFCTYKDNEIVFNEINTLPGFTSISMYPKLFAHEGIAYADLIDNLLRCALEEHHG